LVYFVLSHRRSGFGTALRRRIIQDAKNFGRRDNFSQNEKDSSDRDKILGLLRLDRSNQEGLIWLLTVLLLFLANNSFSQTAATSALGSVKGLVLDQ
jgi:hypothetical protein